MPVSTHNDNTGGSRRAGRVAQQRWATRRGMTMVEILFAVLIIFLVMGLLIGAVRMVTRSARDTAHQAAGLALKQAVDHFQQEFGFIPPLVRDWGNNPPALGEPIRQDGPQGQWRPRIYTVGDHATFLRTVPARRFVDPDSRFSVHTIPYYLIGVLNQPRGGGDPRDREVAIDGVSGPGFRTPRRDGSFEAAGRTFDPFFAIGSGSTTLYTAGDQPGRIELRDANGVPFRYYRWEPERGDIASARRVREHTNLPLVVARYVPGDDPWPDQPGEAAEQPAPRIMAARYAIVGAGPDGLVGDEFMFPAGHPLHVSLEEMEARLRIRPEGSRELRAAVVMRTAMEDNIVEVGQ